MNAPSSLVASSSSPLMRRIARPTWKRTLGPKKKKQSMRRNAKTSGMEEMNRDMNQGNDATESCTSTERKCSCSIGRQRWTRCSNTFSARVSTVSDELTRTVE